MNHLQAVRRWLRHVGHRSEETATSLVTIYLVLLYVIPSNLSIAGMGSMGRPAGVFGLGMLVWWVASRLADPQFAPSGRQPVKLAVFIFTGAALASFAAAQLRGLPPDETSPALSGILRLAGLAGLFLVLNDAIQSRAALNKLERRFILLCTFMAALGLAQFFTHQSIVGNLQIPGLSADIQPIGLKDRNGFVRPSGTATHPLEYAVAVAAGFPFALNAAAYATNLRPLARWAPAGLLATTAILSVTRSALLGIFIGALLVVVTWAPRLRRMALLLGVGLLAATYVLVPGMIGTIRGMFLGVSTDPSVASRTNSYDVAFGIASHFALLGRGLGTFLPEYRILDNQYLLMIVELGAIGTALFLLVLATAGASALRARRSVTSLVGRHQAQSAVAALTAVAVMYAFFDALSFPIAAGTTFFLTGVCGSLRNIAAQEQTVSIETGVTTETHGIALAPAAGVRHR